MKMQKVGGYASIISICVVVVAIGFAALVSSRVGLPLFSVTPVDPLKVMAAYESSPSYFRALQPSGVLIAIVLILVALGVQERMRTKAPELMRLAVIAASVAFALLLANAISGTSGMLSIASKKDVSAYTSFTLVQNGLSSAAFTAWGLALLLMGCAAIKTRALPRILGYICLVCGILFAISFAMPNTPPGASATVGLVVVLTGVLLNVLGAIWLGVVLIRNQEPSMA